MLCCQPQVVGDIVECTLAPGYHFCMYMYELNFGYRYIASKVIQDQALEVGLKDIAVHLLHPRAIVISRVIPPCLQGVIVGLCIL